MTVKELIELLQKQDPDKKVTVCVTDEGDAMWRVLRITPAPDIVYIDCGW